MQSLLQANELKIARSLPDAAVLVDELRNFRASISEAGFASFSARSGKHDDLVLAVAIAAWWMLRAARDHGDSSLLIPAVVDGNLTVVEDAHEVSESW